MLPGAITRWLEELDPAPLAEVAPEPARTAVFCADMTVGFCRAGALASPRVDALTEPVVTLFERARAHGISDFVLVQDAHTPGAAEFSVFPPHCERGSDEARTIPEISSLPFAETFTVIEKDSLHPSLGTGLEEWLVARPDLSSAIVVGDCTDLCVHQLAMHLRLRANVLRTPGFEVHVPASCVATYDLPEGAGGMAHDGDLFHALFLYHLALNGVRVWSELI